MRKLVYVTDDTTYSTMLDAQASGKPYKTEVVEIPEPICVDAKQLAKRVTAK